MKFTLIEVISAGLNVTPPTSGFLIQILIALCDDSDDRLHLLFEFFCSKLLQLRLQVIQK